jgi:hypothetical protein
VNARALYHLAKADFLERVRRYSFLVTLAFAVYLGLAAARGQISLRLGDYTGLPNSAWVGTVMSMTTTVFLSLAGFFIVSNSVHRDELTRVGRVLAATPMSRFAYTLAKALSNFAVLSAMVMILAIAGVASVLIHKTAPLELRALLWPFLFIALPTMAVVAAVAVFFEVTPILRRISAFAYFFLWVFVLASATKSPLFDLTGMHLISTTMTSALRLVDPNYGGGISFGMIIDGVGAAQRRRSFLWTGIPWTPSMMLQRMLGFPVAAAIALLPALWFHRFDPSRARLKGAEGKSSSQAVAPAANELPQMNVTTLHASQLTVARGQSSAVASLVALIACELRLLAARRKWWIYAIAAGLIVASFLAPLEAARHGLVAAIWILPMLVWSRLGAREDLFATRSLIFISPGAALWPLLASWVAGACVPLVLASGIIVRLAASGDFRSAAALVAGAFFVVALALALGNIGRTPKLFEAIYVVLWYIGPLQALRGLDFVGVTQATALPEVFTVLAVALVVAAWGVRTFRLRSA